MKRDCVCKLVLAACKGGYVDHVATHLTNAADHAYRFNLPGGEWLYLLHDDAIPTLVGPPTSGPQIIFHPAAHPELVPDSIANHIREITPPRQLRLYDEAG